MPGFRFAVRRGQKSTPMDLMGVLFEAELLGQSSHDLFPRGMEGTAPSRVTAMEDALELIFRISGTGMPGDPGEYI